MLNETIELQTSKIGELERQLGERMLKLQGFNDVKHNLERQLEEERHVVEMKDSQIKEMRANVDRDEAEFDGRVEAIKAQMQHDMEEKIEEQVEKLMEKQQEIERQKKGFKDKIKPYMYRP